MSVKPSRLGQAQSEGIPSKKKEKKNCGRKPIQRPTKRIVEVVGEFDSFALGKRRNAARKKMCEDFRRIATDRGKSRKKRE